MLLSLGTPDRIFNIHDQDEKHAKLGGEWHDLVPVEFMIPKNIK